MKCSHCQHAGGTVGGYCPNCGSPLVGSRRAWFWEIGFISLILLLLLWWASRS
jgi:hypothetical protein